MPQDVWSDGSIDGADRKFFDDSLKIPGVKRFKVDWRSAGRINLRSNCRATLKNITV
ncbi:unnamed protein product [marine sediment metagenome]|uniref:Uncharacterized protein n=1 Tax=marine sediment metagenome TaxID=412755 RepID=X1RFI6_9ZZZZ